MGRWILLLLAFLVARAAADSSLPEDSPGFGQERRGASRTQLRDGRILIAGGLVKGDELPVPTVELYDPRTNRFARAEPMHAARADHRATRLHDGRVLVTGNLYSKNFAEIWDPRSGHWTEIAAPRSVGQHTATRLRDGRVLIAGGRVHHDCNVTSDQALIFDPESNQLLATGNLAETRAEHSAILLFDGRVLVVGGYHFPNADPICTALPHIHDPSAEVWDPRTGRWSAAGTIAEWRAPPFFLTGRSSGGADLSGGTWDAPESPDDNCLVRESGARCTPRPADYERWNPSTGKWTRMR